MTDREAFELSYKLLTAYFGATTNLMEKLAANEIRERLPELKNHMALAIG